jgi:hypothetical protein
MQYSYRIPYHHPRTGLAGVAILHSIAEAVVERARLQALGYTVDEILMPIGARPHLPPVSPLGHL